MRKKIDSFGLETHRFPVEPWSLKESRFSTHDYGWTETLFTVANGYLGMRGNPEEGREAHSHGTFINGFHETWKIRHAEEAYGFAKVGQTIVNVPDTKLIKLYADDEPLLLAHADLEDYERKLDFQSGILTRQLLWKTPGGKRVLVKSSRLVSFEHRHLALMTFEVTSLDSKISFVISSQLLNRQDGEDEYHVRSAALGEGHDPRKSNIFDHRVLEARLQRDAESMMVFGYRCTNSKMTLAAGYTHLVESTVPYEVENKFGPDNGKSVFTFQLKQGEVFSLTKLVAYHTSTGVPAEELADRCQRTLRFALNEGCEKIQEGQRQWLDQFWKKSDIRVEDSPALQQALRWDLFQLAQATGRAQESGIPAKGVSSAAYDGHYFWDTEIYILPFLTYTNPEMARKLLRFRGQLLPAAKLRARELSQRGALYPWRTINGQEASAYYAAGTAQYHINAAIAYAIKRYYDATDDFSFLCHEGAPLLVETARLWEDLGFFSRKDGIERFHIHRVTGPDEYTTVVNDNFYTNVMARFHLRFAAEILEDISRQQPALYKEICLETGLKEDEIARWKKCAEKMYLPYDEDLGIHPQDANFLDLEPWDFEQTPSEHYPLLLNYHPLVIYRHQVLKQADVVLGLFLQGEHFTLEQKRRDFDFYDPLTTGDSSLSMCVQSIVASQVGYEALSFDYFQRALYLDLMNLHGNSADGIHVASAGGVWACVVYGFAGFFDGKDWVSFHPRLPKDLGSIRFNLMHHASEIGIELEYSGCVVRLIEGGPLKVKNEGKEISILKGESVFIKRFDISTEVVR